MITTRLAPRARLGAALLLAAACALNQVRINRSTLDDGVKGRLGRLEILGELDPFFARIGAVNQLRAEPSAERWPNEDFAELIFEAMPEGTPRVGWAFGGRCPFFFYPHLTRLALERGRRVRSTELWEIEPTEWPATLEKLDFLIVDSARFPLAGLVLAIGAKTELRARVLAEQLILPGRAMALVALER